MSLFRMQSMHSTRSSNLLLQPSNYPDTNGVDQINFKYHEGTYENYIYRNQKVIDCGLGNPEWHLVLYRWFNLVQLIGLMVILLMDSIPKHVIIGFETSRIRWSWMG